MVSILVRIANLRANFLFQIGSMWPPRVWLRLKQYKTAPTIGAQNATVVLGNGPSPTQTPPTRMTTYIPTSTKMIPRDRVF